jgi:hypothetical protein
MMKTKLQELTMPETPEEINIEEKADHLQVIKNGLVGALRDGVTHLQFRKVNGDTRNMIATLKTDLIPEDKIPEAGKERKESVALVVLYDLEVAEWRSLRTENLVEYRCEAWQA